MSQLQLQEILAQLLFFVIGPCALAILLNDLVRKLDRKDR